MTVLSPGLRIGDAADRGSSIVSKQPGAMPKGQEL